MKKARNEVKKARSGRDNAQLDGCRPLKPGPSQWPTLVSRISVQARISVQGGILIKILECRVKTGNFIHNKRDS